VSYAEAEVHLAAARVALDAELGDRRVRVVESQPNPHGVAIEIDPQSGVVRVVVGSRQSPALPEGGIIEADQ
jgi:hypothetical protein